MKLCIICLRCDKELNSLSSDFIEFHDELCDFSLPTDVTYCTDCEHLLKKFYKFQKQCVRSLKIYLKWRATKATKRPPLNNLHNLLPPSSLDYWEPSPRIATIVLNEQTDDVQINYIYRDEAHPFSQEYPKFTSKSSKLRKPTSRSEKKSKPIRPIEEIKVEKDDEDSTDNMTIRDFIQNVGLFNEIKNNGIEKNADVKSENVLDGNRNPDNDNGKFDEVNGNFDSRNGNFDDGVGNFDRKQRFDEKTGKFIDVDAVADVNAKFAEDNVNFADGTDYAVDDDNFAADDDNYDDEVEKIQEVEINDEDFLKSLEGMDFDRIDSDDDDVYDDVKKERRPKGKYHKQHMPFDINKLKSDLKKKLATFDEVLAKDGTPIDTELILQSLGERSSYHDLRSLRAACKTGSKKLKEALQSFYERYQEDDKFQAIFDIQYLSTYEMKLDEFEKRKTYDYYVNAEYKCDVCYTPFKRAKDLENHTKDHHEETPENAGECCPICKVRPGKRQYKRNAHSSTHSAVYKCKLCPMVTYYRGTMRNHYAMHSGKLYNCDDCGSSFKWQSAYFLHMSKYHRRKQHVCATCGRGFPSTLALSAHAKKHQDEPPLPADSSEGVSCAECDVTFPSHAVYGAHIQDVHTTPPAPAPRGPRGDPGTLPTYRATHIDKWRKPRTQHKIRPVKCKLCSTVRLGAAWLKTHFKREHPTEDWNMWYANVKKHLCDICGSGFASVYVLRDHMNLHTGARPFPCDLCPKRFRSSVLMRDHRARHFPPTNLCTLCGKKFKSKSNLFNHMKVHTGEKSHKCEICGKCFQYSTTLNEHVRGVHHNIRRVRRSKPHADKHDELQA